MSSSWIITDISNPVKISLDDNLFRLKFLQKIVFRNTSEQFYGISFLDFITNQSLFH